MVVETEAANWGRRGSAGGGGEDFEYPEGLRGLKEARLQGLKGGGSEGGGLSVEVGALAGSPRPPVLNLNFPPPPSSHPALHFSLG